MYLRVLLVYLCAHIMYLCIHPMCLGVLHVNGDNPCTCAYTRTYMYIPYVLYTYVNFMPITPSFCAYTPFTSIYVHPVYIRKHFVAVYAPRGGVRTLPVAVYLCVHPMYLCAHIYLEITQYPCVHLHISVYKPMYLCVYSYIYVRDIPHVHVCKLHAYYPKHLCLLSMYLYVFTPYVHSQTLCSCICTLRRRTYTSCTCVYTMYLCALAYGGWGCSERWISCHTRGTDTSCSFPDKRHLISLFCPGLQK